jgi:protein-disulfide isomerase
VSQLARIAVAFLAFALLPAASARPAHDWTRTVSVTADGGFRMGNPAARIQIVEYGSLTCPHCRHLAETAMTPLVDAYVKTGKASFEYRSMILNELDAAATLVARCGGPAHFFPLAETLYARQPEWIDRVQAMSPEEFARIQALPGPQERLALANAAKLFPIAAANGIPEAKAKACVTSDADADKLQAMYDAALATGIQGTPTVLVNDNVVAAGDWETLEPYLKDAGG